MELVNYACPLLEYLSFSGMKRLLIKQIVRTFQRNLFPSFRVKDGGKRLLRNVDIVHPVRHALRFIDHVTTFQRDYYVLCYITCFGLTLGHLQILISKIILKPLCYTDIRLHLNSVALVR
jgi:hypothetical protein